MRHSYVNGSAEAACRSGSWSSTRFTVTKRMANFALILPPQRCRIYRSLTRVPVSQWSSVCGGYAIRAMAEKSGSTQFVLENDERTLRERLVVWARGFFFDRLGNASRPKLLFAVATADVVSVVAAWPLSNMLRDTPFVPSWASFAATMLVALLTVGVLHGQWSYSIPSLRRFAPQVLKVLTSLGRSRARNFGSCVSV